MLRVRCVALQLAAQLGDVRIDRARGDGVVVPPHCAQKVMTCERSVGVAEQLEEKLERAGCERYLLAVTADHTTRRVYLDVANLPDRWSSRCRVGPAEQRLDPKHELHYAERLRDIVVRACAKSAHPVNLLGARAQDQHRGIYAAGTEGREHLVAVDPGKH